jgi:transcription elongation factor Elf1
MRLGADLTCPCCGQAELESTVQKKRSDATLMLHDESDLFLKASVQMKIIDCPNCGYRHCLDWEVLLDEHPENVLNAAAAI